MCADWSFPQSTLHMQRNPAQTQYITNGLHESWTITKTAWPAEICWNYQNGWNAALTYVTSWLRRAVFLYTEQLNSDFSRTLSHNWEELLRSLVVTDSLSTESKRDGNCVSTNLLVRHMHRLATKYLDITHTHIHTYTHRNIPVPPWNAVS